MEFCSYFIKDKALFGSYPTIKSADELKKENVLVFVDLTCEEEKTNLEKYYSLEDILYLSYPIQDRKYPVNAQHFSLFIMLLASTIKKLPNNKKIYIHCKGGHGRAGIVVACLLCFMYNMIPETALDLTTQYHDERKTMRAKWRKLGSPQTKSQKGFVIRICKPLHFYKAYKQGPTVGFSNFSEHTIKIDDFGTFQNSESAFQAYKEPDNQEYVKKIENIKIPRISKEVGRKCKLRSDWFEVRNGIMEKILRLKIEQHSEIKENLMETFLRPIIEHTRADICPNLGYRSFVKNRLGKLWTKIRNELYLFNIDLFPEFRIIFETLDIKE